MTDRHAAYLIVFEEDLEGSASERAISALRMVRGVLSVEPVLGDIAAQIYANREKTRVRQILLAAMKEVAEGGNYEKLAIKRKEY